MLCFLSCDNCTYCKSLWTNASVREIERERNDFKIKKNIYLSDSFCPTVVPNHLMQLQH